MRALVALSLLAVLAACTSDPQSWGITGPGPPPAPAAAPSEAADDPAAPGVSTSGPLYGPSNRPTSGPSGFFGYN
jgi:hypothetical protein